MSQTVQKKFAGDTWAKRFRFYNDADALFDPDTISIALKDPTGTTITTKTKSDLTNESVGVYKLLYNIPSNATKGIWTAEVTATKTAGSLQNTEKFAFYVQ